MTTSNKTIAALVGGALVASVAGSVIAAENPFAAKSLAKGYMVAEADGKMKDGKCATGKCGSSMKKEKAKEGSCSSDKAKEGSCSSDKKAKEGSCSSDKAKEGSCKH